MKKISLYAPVIAILLFAIAFLPGKKNKDARSESLNQLRASVRKNCVCMPSPGSVCLSAETGNIYLDYKVVCEGEPGYPFSSATAMR